MKYENIMNAITANAQHHKEQMQNYITADESALQRNSTATRWNQYKTGKIDRATAEKYAIERTNKQTDKRTIEQLRNLERIENAPEIKDISIEIEWKRNRTWGANPTATATVHTAEGWKRYTGTASGCGYDKESAAVASALNACASIRKALADVREANGGKETQSPTWDGTVGLIPAIDGGIGMGTVKRILETAGIKCTSEHHGKMFDAYYFG